jgi:hypothetical protein
MGLQQNSVEISRSQFQGGRSRTCENSTPLHSDVVASDTQTLRRTANRILEANKYSPCPAETRERLSCASPSRPHCNYCHTKTKQNQQRVKNCRLRRCSFRRRRFWPTRKFDRNLDLRTCPRLETPLRIRFKSSAIKLFVSGALQHSRSGNFAGLLINRHQNHAFPCEALFRPFRSVNRFRRIDRLWRLWCTAGVPIWACTEETETSASTKPEPTAVFFRSGNSVASANQPRRCRAHLRIRHSIHASVQQVMNESRRESESEQHRQPCGCS